MRPKLRSKYGAQKTVVDGHRFDSKREARRYQELKLLEKAGEIQGLVLQPRYDLEAPSPFGTTRRKIGAYVGDFEYFDIRKHGIVVVEDVKGFKTPLYKWKKRHVEIQYGIIIQEV